MTSYANCLKVHSVGFDNETTIKVLSAMETDEFNDAMNDLLREFAEGYDYQWQAFFNGRSGGYLVLYTGGLEPSGYRSFCRNCGQRNFTSVDETGQRCGRCGKASRVDYSETHMNIKTSAASVDANADYGEWSMSDLRIRVEIIQAFDALCDSIVAEAKYLADNFRVETETVYVPQKRRVLVETAV
jgi:hypothetical protein